MALTEKQREYHEDMARIYHNRYADRQRREYEREQTEAAKAEARAQRLRRLFHTV